MKRPWQWNVCWLVGDRLSGAVTHLMPHSQLPWHLGDWPNQVNLDVWEKPVRFEVGSRQILADGQLTFSRVYLSYACFWLWKSLDSQSSIRGASAKHLPMADQVALATRHSRSLSGNGIQVKGRLNNHWHAAVLRLNVHWWLINSKPMSFNERLSRLLQHIWCCIKHNPIPA